MLGPAREVEQDERRGHRAHRARRQPQQRRYRHDLAARLQRLDLSALCAARLQLRLDQPPRVQHAAAYSPRQRRGKLRLRRAVLAHQQHRARAIPSRGARAMAVDGVSSQMV